MTIQGSMGGVEGSDEARVEGRRVHLQYANVEMNLFRRTALRSDLPLELNEREFDLLECFLRNPERRLGRDQIGMHVWGMVFDKDSNVPEVYVRRLQRKLSEGNEMLIHEDGDGGYMLSQRPPGNGSA